MVEHRNARGNGERIEGTFPIWETNGDTKMKNISPSALPHFHGLTIEDPNTFFFFSLLLFVELMTMQKMSKSWNYSLLLSRMQHCVGSSDYLEIASQLGLRCSKPLTTSIETIVGQKILKKKCSEWPYEVMSPWRTMKRGSSSVTKGLGVHLTRSL